MKEYTTPRTEIIPVQTQTIICGSAEQIDAH